ncbi:MAG TPA: aryl-sulfate sulfotransferase [Bacteroidia bacterium]|nr:aryl-sulfate sulfotransferase [Bacteroidia bacterium]
MKFPRLSFLPALLLLPAFYSGQNIPPFAINVCASSSAGFYFLVPLNTSSGNSWNQLILDEKGNVVYYKEFTNSHPGDFKIHPDGRMSYGYGAQFFIMDSTFTVLDSFTCQNGILHDGHDIQLLSNGNVLLLGIENVPMDLSMYQFFGPNHNLPGSVNATVKCGVIQEQDANHNVVFEWHAKDHYAFDDVTEEWLGSPANVDWTHFNAIESDTDGNILVSVRHFNEITKISRSTGSIIWRMGGNENQFTFTNDPQMFKGQHDIRRIPNGNLTMLDNGDAGPPFHPVAGKEYNINVSSMTATLIWNYSETPSVYSLAIGNMQRLANGNSLINYGFTPGQTLMFNVIDSTGGKIFEIEFADTLRTYRAFNYLSLPWLLPRPQITCFMVGSQYFLDAGSGHASYLWSTGATTQTIPVMAADTFSVFVPLGQGGFLRSHYFIVSDLLNPCGPAGIFNAQPQHFSVYPIPATNEIRISLQSPFADRINVNITDISGRKIFSKLESPSNGRLILDVSDLSPGTYFIQVDGITRIFVRM